MFRLVSLGFELKGI